MYGYKNIDSPDKNITKLSMQKSTHWWLFRALAVSMLWISFHLMLNTTKNLKSQVLFGFTSAGGILFIFYLFLSEISFNKNFNFIEKCQIYIILFFIFLQCFFLPFKISNIHKILSFIDPSLKSNYTDSKDFTTDCRFRWKTILSVVDFYCICHLASYIYKIILTRDPIYTMYLSVYWEFSEIIFNKILPEFRECWWDSLILDILICNTIGIFIGYKLLKPLNLKCSSMGRVKIYPDSDYKTDYGSFTKKILKRACLLTYGSLLMNIGELNFFFMKQTYVPFFLHWFNAMRFLFMVLSFYFVTKELLDSFKSKWDRAPVFNYLLTFYFFMEFALFYKHCYEYASKFELNKTIVWVMGQFICCYCYVNFSYEYKKNDGKISKSNFQKKLF